VNFKTVRPNMITTIMTKKCVSSIFIYFVVNSVYLSPVLRTLLLFMFSIYLWIIIINISLIGQSSIPVVRFAVQIFFTIEDNRKWIRISNRLHITDYTALAKATMSQHGPCNCMLICRVTQLDDKLYKCIVVFVNFDWQYTFHNLLVSLTQ